MSQSTPITKSMLRRKIHHHLINSGFSHNKDGYHIKGPLTKQRIRDLHLAKRIDLLDRNRFFINKRGMVLADYLANGSEIDPEAIQPTLVEVKSETIESDLFRFATSLWSVPVSQGFGRRIRFLVKDTQNDKLIGIFALGDPVFNLSARDNYIGWSGKDRQTRLVQVMDAYVLGAVPPYSMLIGGKLVAALIGSVEVSSVFDRKYYSHRSIISGKAKHPKLALITTTSALGRSSLLNRLKIPNGIQAKKIGSTRGFGHFHISDSLFEMMRTYLAQTNHPYATANRFGDGPNWRMRVVRTVLEDIGLERDNILKHGIEREVYIIPLAINWREILLGKEKNMQSIVLPAATISEYCLQRWIIPRSLRDDSYKQFSNIGIVQTLLDNGPPAKW